MAEPQKSMQDILTGLQDDSRIMLLKNQRNEALDALADKGAELSVALAMIESQRKQIGELNNTLTAAGQKIVQIQSELATANNIITDSQATVVKLQQETTQHNELLRKTFEFAETYGVLNELQEHLGLPQQQPVTETIFIPQLQVVSTDDQKSLTGTAASEDSAQPLEEATDKAA